MTVTVTQDVHASPADPPRNSQPDHKSKPVRSRWWILGVVSLAQLMVVLDATVVNIALPTAQHDLGFGNDDRQWVITAYALAFGGLLLVGGRLSDRYGRERMLVIGMVGFAIASTIGGSAVNFEMLVLGRAIQGLFGAILAPAALSTLNTAFTDPAARGKAFGVYGAVSGAGGAIGLLLGGVLTEYLSWRATLFVNLVFAVFAVAAAVYLLTFGRGDRDVRLDPLGTVLVVAGLICIVYGLAEAETASWTSALTLSLLVIGAVLLVAFVLVERRSRHALLPLRIVLDRFRGGAYLTILLAGMAIFAVFLFLTYYLQVVRGFSPVMTGVAFLPMIAVQVASSTLSSTFLLPRLGPRLLIPPALLIAGGGMVYLALALSVDGSYVRDALGPLIIIGLGMGTVFAVAMNTATYGAGPEDSGVASALVNTSQQIGGAIGTALLNTIAGTTVATYIATHPRGPDVAAAAAVESYRTAFWIAAAILFGAAIIAGLVLRSGRLAPREHTHIAPAAG